jgi:ABC-type branched-subunit amino acid transport system ATPase component
LEVRARPGLIPAYDGICRVAANGTTVLLVVQNERGALKQASFAFALQPGCVVAVGAAADLAQSDLIGTLRR